MPSGSWALSCGRVGEAGLGEALVPAPVVACRRRRPSCDRDCDRGVAESVGGDDGAADGAADALFFGRPIRRSGEYTHPSPTLEHRRHDGLSWLHLTLRFWQASHDARSLAPLFVLLAEDATPVPIAPPCAFWMKVNGPVPMSMSTSTSAFKPMLELGGDSIA